MKSQRSVEERLTALEQRMAELQIHHANGSDEKPWLRTMGMFAGDEGMKEIFDEALRIREKNRQSTRQRAKKRSTRGATR